MTENVSPSVTRSFSGNTVKNSSFDNKNFIENKIAQNNNGKNVHTQTNIEINTGDQNLREFILKVLKTIGFYGMRFGGMVGTFTLLREGAFEEAKAFGTFSVTCMFVDKIFDEGFWQQIQTQSLSKSHYR